MASMNFGVEIDDPELKARILAGIESTKRELTAAIDTDQAFIAEASTHLMNAGGKRFRPLLVMLCAEFGQSVSHDVVQAAVAVELTHLATLYHDDVMDEAAMRRGEQSANARYDNSLAILVGDYLFARASAVVSELGPEAVKIQAVTFSRLVQGQIRETLGPGDGDDLLQHYLEVVSDKTGSLIATAARYGAMMSGAPLATEQALTEFGERIGTAFQLSDDVIDVTSESTDSGKTPGTDLREGVATLPVILARQSTDPADGRLQELLAGPLVDDELHAEALGLLRQHRAIEEARDFVRAEAASARKLLADLPELSARTALASLCDRVVDRLG